MCTWAQKDLLLQSPLRHVVLVPTSRESAHAVMRDWQLAAAARRSPLRQHERTREARVAGLNVSSSDQWESDLNCKRREKAAAAGHWRSADPGMSACSTTCAPLAVCPRAAGEQSGMSRSPDVRLRKEDRELWRDSVVLLSAALSRTPRDVLAGTTLRTTGSASDQAPDPPACAPDPRQTKFQDKCPRTQLQRREREAAGVHEHEPLVSVLWCQRATCSSGARKHRRHFADFSSA